MNAFSALALDAPTLLFVIAILSFLMAAVVFAAATAASAKRMGLSEWGWAMTAVGAACLLCFFRREGSCLPLVLIGYVLLMSAPAWTVLAVARLCDRAAPCRTIGVLCALGVSGALATAVLDMPRQVALIALASAGSLLLGLAAAMIVRVLPRKPARASLVTAGLLGAMSTLAAIQPLLAGRGRAGMLLIDALCIVATTIGYLSMVDARRRCAASERARRDGLTGLYTKSAFFEMADQIDRQAEPVAYAMVMIDLDHFKSINDTFGHAAGDTVLEQTAQLIARSVRLTDIAARYGGEEFCILLRDCGAEEAARFAERPVAEASQLTVRLRDNRMASFTMSVGYACRGGSTGDGVRATFERADQALYLAKRAGRNRALQAIFTDSPLVEQVC